MRIIDADKLVEWLTKDTGFRTNCEDCTSIDCLDCIIGEAIQNAPTVDVPQWVSVEERLPDSKGQYLVAYHPCYWDNVREETVVGNDNYRGGTTWARNKYQRVTHWMPLPQPPKEKE